MATSLTQISKITSATSIASTPTTSALPTPTMTLSNVYSARAADINSDGKADLISERSDGYSNPSSLPPYVNINDGRGGFNTGVLFFDYSGGVKVADFNGDGKNDLLFSDGSEVMGVMGATKSLYFSLNNGGSYFSLPTYLGDCSSSTTNNMVNIAHYATGDFNSDGRLDVVTTDNDYLNGNRQLNVSVFFNDGKNGFNAPITNSYSSASNMQNGGIDSIADFNGDNQADLLIDGNVLFSDGDGSFTQPVAVDSSSPITGTYHVADFNGDGIADLYSSQSVLMNDGTGDFSSTFSNTSYNITGTADFNGDGKSDLIIGKAPDESAILIGNGNGRFGAPVRVNGTIEAIADFNNDGRTDLILGDGMYSSPAITTVQMNDGFGNFGNSITVSGNVLWRTLNSSMGGAVYEDVEAPSKLTVADFNGDGRPDLITKDSQSPTGRTINVFDSFIFSGSSVVTTSVTTDAVNHAPTGGLAISGTATQAQTLTFKNTISDSDGLGDLNYQWLSDGKEIVGATGLNYVLAATDVGKKISVQVSYLDGEGNNELVTSDSTTAVIALSKATNGNDQITGTAKAEKIDGLAGNDLISGLEGNDTLIGGAGLDTLIGGAGADNLTGGSDADVFKFTALADSGTTSKLRDIITDFVSKVDKIDISTLDANAKLAGDQAFSFIGNAAFSKIDATGQLRFDTTSHVLYGSVNADNKPEFSIQLNGVNSLVATDFVL